jgi:molybdopterin molybdotransferase
MISPDEALTRLLALATPVAKIDQTPLIEATNRWAATDINAQRTQPARDLSAMDGYAIRHADMPGPWHIIGESAAGTPFAGTVGPGQAARIFTGAAVPSGADSIIIQEDVTREPVPAQAGSDSITLTGDGPPAPGTHIRRAGSDFTIGQTLIEAGSPLTSARIGLAAIAGHATLPVRRAIKVALISTGDELVPLGTEPGEDRLPASNAVMLSALLKHLPVDITDLGIIPDDKAVLTATFDSARRHDVIVPTGGASVGDHDLVRPALLDAGATIDFWKIAMRPGKPLMAGTLGKAVVLGLPGNPVSAFVTATLFLKPLIAHLSGAKDPAPRVQTATLAAPLPAVGIRTDYVRAYWHDGSVKSLDGDSGMLVPLAAADALIIRPAGSAALDKGATVNIISLS